MSKTVIAIDPGNNKCGIAVVKAPKDLIFHGITATSEVEDYTNKLIKQFNISLILLGNATFSKQIHGKLKNLNSNCKIKIIDEKFSTQNAKKLYFIDNPPKGLWKLIPISLQTPKVPVDDYAALYIAIKYFSNI